MYYYIDILMLSIYLLKFIVKLCSIKVYEIIIIATSFENNLLIIYYN